MQKDIVITGAREHNLKNISITLPREKFIVITGLSGSGKSTLAFDTLYAEGQRRYVESLSAYARQFLGLMNKPDVDAIDGLSPAISIEQKATSKNPRSTVGTVTEIYDYLRLLFARIGVPHCPVCRSEIRPQSPQQISNQIFEKHNGKNVIILAPVIQGKKGTYEKEMEKLQKDGFARMRIDTQIFTTDQRPKLKRYEKHWIEAVVDRLEIKDYSRLNDAVEQALKYGKNTLIILDQKKEKEKEIKKKEIQRGAGEEIYTADGACLNHPDISFEELQPRMFSFNSPFGACSECDGLGIRQVFDEDMVIPDKTKSILDGAIEPLTKMDRWYIEYVKSAARKFGFSITKPLKEWKKEERNTLLYGSEKKIESPFFVDTKKSYEGIIPRMERIYKDTESEHRKNKLEHYITNLPCQRCQGKRLSEKALAVTINKKSIIDLTDMPIKETQMFFNSIKLTKKEATIAKLILKEINARLEFLVNVGLEYLTLSRTASTLSGGEAQRIRLATQIGANLMGVLYILDEPSIGLHQKNNHKLIETLTRLRDIGNTVIVVEHDEDTIKAADYVIDMGPGAGIHGGSVVATGTPKEVMQNSASLTGQYLAGKKKISVPEKRRRPLGWLQIRKAGEHNLKNIDVEIPTGVFTCITGVSGSGKSTLIHDILYKALMKRLYNSKERPGRHGGLVLDNTVNRVILVDQSPIGRTPRSNPATYTKVFDDIRKIFAQTKEAKLRGYKEGRFSFNVKGGRCETCQGDGVIKIEMNFLPDIYVDCEECKVKRYNKETLQVLYKQKSIADVLSMTVEEAFEFFKHIPSIERKLATLNDVGLSYIGLGQASTTLSGGEAQRIKLTRELAKRSIGHAVYILDEPTTGLHFEDVKKLLKVLGRLTDKKNTIVVIEHNLDVIKTADYIIDLGPEGGDEGGQIVAKGTPEEVSNINGSHTAPYLKVILNKK